MIEGILTGKEVLPRRVLLYGTHGIGKSTFAASAPSPIFVQTEDGLADIGAARFPVSESYGDVKKNLYTLYSGDHKYHTIAIDSVDWLERLIFSAVCSDAGVANIDDVGGGFGKGQSAAGRYWLEIFEALTRLRKDRKMSIILIAHSKVEKFSDPSDNSYDRYVPRLHKTTSNIVSEWVDEILFARYRTNVIETKEDFGKKKHRGIGTGERTVYTEERPGHIAKNRLGLPEEMPLSWEAYASHIGSNGKATTTAKKGAK